MPKYHRTVTITGKSATEIYRVVSAGIERFLSKTPVGNHRLDYNQDAHCIEIKSSMLNAKLVCGPENITLDGNLSLVALPFKGKLDEGIDRWIAKNFPA